MRTLSLVFVVALVVACEKAHAVPQTPQSAEATPTHSQSTPVSEVVLGSIEPDYLFPWVVKVWGNLDGHGSLIGRHWVLTAAHLVPTMPFNIPVRYSRTSSTGVRTSGELIEGTAVNVHPDYDPATLQHDIALVHLRYPLDNDNPDPLLQPVELPVVSAPIGQSGTIASTTDHTGGPLPPGMLSVLRGAVIGGAGPSAIVGRSEQSSLCPGDSGSGFVTTISGKNSVIGIASYLEFRTDCVAPNEEFILSDVYGHLDWIGQVTRLVGQIQGTGDFNGDGKSDILWRNANGTVAIWFMNDGAIKQQSLLPVKPGSDWQIQGTGDFNGNGKCDILWRNSNGTVAIWFMNGDEIRQQSSLPVVPGNEWQIQGTADFNMNDKCDILWRNSNGTVAIWFMNGDEIRQQSSLPVVPGNEWQIQGIGDFNANGKSDILWRNANGTVAIWFMNGDEIRQQSSLPVVPGNDWQIQGTGDFNGNGKCDILWRNSNGTVAIWFMNGDEIRQQSSLPVVPGRDWQIQGTGDSDFNANRWGEYARRDAPRRIQGTGFCRYRGFPFPYWACAPGDDFNANGKSDILWRNRDKTVAIWFMDGDAIKAQAFPFSP